MVKPDQEKQTTIGSEMKELFHKAKIAVETEGALRREHVLDLVKTILGRRRMEFSISQIICESVV